MFTKDELLANWRSFRDWTMPPLEVSYFGHSDFTSSSSEQIIVVARGFKAHVGDALQFWFGVGDVVDWYDHELRFSRSIEAALCEPIGEGEFLSNATRVGINIC